MRRSLLIAFAALLVLPGARAAVRTHAANCVQTSEPMTPLTDTGAKRLYPAITAALYANGANMPTHDATIVDGAQGGQDAEIVKDPSARFWAVVDQRLSAAGATAQQVQVVWLKEAIAQENEPFPQDALRLRADLAKIVGNLKQRFPKLQLVYLSSRTYAGYATTTLNPEPYAYDSGFAVKWLVLHREEGKIGGPWLGWGPYLWTNETRGRKDGLTWTCADVRSNDGTHPSAGGQAKGAALLWKFFTTDPTAKNWFLTR